MDLSRLLMKDEEYCYVNRTLLMKTPAFTSCPRVKGVIFRRGGGRGREEREREGRERERGGSMKDD